MELHGSLWIFYDTHELSHVLSITSHPRLSLSCFVFFSSTPSRLAHDAIFTSRSDIFHELKVLYAFKLFHWMKCVLDLSLLFIQVLPHWTKSLERISIEQEQNEGCCLNYFFLFTHNLFSMGWMDWAGTSTKRSSCIMEKRFICFRLWFFSKSTYSSVIHGTHRMPTFHLVGT